MKKYLLCSRRAGFVSGACAAFLFALPFIASIPYSKSALLHIFEVNLHWICFFVFLALDASKVNFGRSIIYGVTIAVLYLALLSCLFFGPSIDAYAHRQQFDSAAWKAAAWKTDTGKHSEIRLHMVDNLLRRYRLVGMSRAQIIDLLGPPNPIESGQTDAEYFYYLGPERSFISIDSELLDIKFNEDKVVSATDRPG